METANLNAPGDVAAGALVRVLHEIAFRLAGRDELAIRLRAAWEQARQVIACDHCMIMLWPERDVLALCEPDCTEACSDRLRQRLEWHARMLDGDIAASLEERPLPAEPQEAIVSGDGATAYLSLPLMGLEGVLGLIYVMRRENRPFGVEEVSLVSIIASQFAACLAHHRYQATLLRASEARGRFLSQVAHELRNALHPARMNVEVIQTIVGVEEQLRRPVERLETSIGQMARLVDDLLDRQRIVNGLVELRRECVDLNLIAATVVENQRPAAEQKSLSLQLERSPEPVLVDGDPGRLDQVITNLVTNAIRYSDSGEVRVAIARSGAGATVRVSDTGIGMDRQTQAHVFELFRTQAADVAHGRGGLGIGLAVVKQLVELHGGSVACRSAGLGQGSEFTVRLPALPEVLVAESAVASPA
jgi:signal transduction histidine kinase